jgi:hypothetical protein
MARIIRMPSEQDLPPGPRRDFVEELHYHYRAAGRPQLRAVTERIAELDAKLNAEEQRVQSGLGTASRETIRRMLRGLTVPRWPAVYAVALALCELSGRDLKGYRWPGHEYDDSSCLDVLTLRWNDAMDEEPAPPAPSPGPGYVSDPWSAPAGAYSDEPPF